MKSILQKPVLKTALLSAVLSIVATPLISFAAVDADAWMGHEILVKSYAAELQVTGIESGEAIEKIINKDRGAIASADRAQTMKNLVAARDELAVLSSKLRTSILKQDTALAVAISGTVVFGTGLGALLVVEGTEKLIGVAEKVTPDKITSINKTLLWTKGFYDRFGKITRRIMIVSAGVGSAGTFYLFYCERKDVQQLATQVASSLDEVEKLLAALDYTGTPAKSK